MRRRKVNWDEEIKKSEEIRRKGLRLTLVTFLMALFWLFGMGHMHKEWSWGSALWVILFLMGGALLIFCVAGKRK
jgi:uncharacterized membrane protein